MAGDGEEQGRLHDLPGPVQKSQDPWFQVMILDGARILK